MRNLRQFFSKIKRYFIISLPNGKTYVPSFSGLSIFALGMVLLTGLYWICYWSSDLSAVTNLSEPTTFNVFMGIAFFLSLISFFDLLYRKKASHILLVLLHGVAVFGYSLTIAIVAFLKGATGTTSGVFYVVAALFCFASLFFYCVKAMDGDADWKYKTATGGAIVFLFLAVCFSYSILDSFSKQDDPVFWLGMLAGILILMESIFATSTSILCDFDPHPLQLDEFGNPIGDITSRL